MRFLLNCLFLILVYNDRKVLLPNLQAVDQAQAELHILNVKKLDPCVKLLFTNLITIIINIDATFLYISSMQ